MRSIHVTCLGAFAALAFGVSAFAASPDPTQAVCPYGGSAATQPAVADSSAAGCPVASVASTQPTAILSLHVVQGTPGGPAIGADTVNIALFANGQLIDQAKAKLAADSTLDVKGLPVTAAVQPIVSIEHGGTTYTATGEALDAQHAQQRLDLTVYETTQIAPKWTVAMRHIITQPNKTGVDVTDMLSIHNPSDHAWIGKADSTGVRQTVSLALPPGATNVKFLSGTSESAANFEGGKLFVHEALNPGDSRYEIQYSVPAANGAAELLVTAPTDVQHILVFVPNDGVALATSGLQAIDPKDLGDMAKQMRVFMATSMTAGQSVSIKFEDLRSEAQEPPSAGPEDVTVAATPPAAVNSAPFPAKIVALTGAGILLLGGGSVLLLKSPKRTK